MGQCTRWLLLVCAMGWLGMAAAQIQPTQLCRPSNWPLIKGVGYSPSPVGDNVITQEPFGDYFTEDYSYLYERDLPLIKAMGANTIRLWQWQYNVNHSHFLDAAYEQGLSVIVSFPLAQPSYENLKNATFINETTAQVLEMVALHMNHPAILMWLIGNELNTPGPTGDCSASLMYNMIVSISNAIHELEGMTNCHPVSSPLADVYNILQILAEYDLDVWTVQLYRGCTFGAFWGQWQGIVGGTSRAGEQVLITEYGIDAYDDLTGAPYPNVQSSCDLSLWSDVMNNTVSAYGASVMEYSDEWWKGINLLPTCQHPACDATSIMNTAFQHGFCGYADESSPDFFKNEEWWGMMQYGSDYRCVVPRQVYYDYKSLWTGNSSEICGPPDQFAGNPCCHAFVPLPTLAVGELPQNCQIDPPRNVSVSGRLLFVNYEVYTIQGVLYSPVPIGSDPSTGPPYGDYFSEQYRSIWERDIPLLRMMGANTITVQFATNLRHDAFLDYCYANNISVIVSFYINPLTYLSPLTYQDLTFDFEELVRLHSAHPSILMWSVGQQANLVFQNQLPEFFYLVSLLKASLLDVETLGVHPMTVSMVSNKNLWPAVSAYDGVVDLWGIEVYMGESFYDLFQQFWQASTLPLWVSGFGMDAYPAEGIYSPDELQAQYIFDLWGEIAANNNTCVGGTLNEWCDEWWRGTTSSTGSVDCASNLGLYHWECGEANMYFPDDFQHDQYMGVMQQYVRNGTTVYDCLEPRAAFYQVMCLWNNQGCYSFNDTTLSVCNTTNCCAARGAPPTWRVILYMLFPMLLVAMGAPVYYAALYLYRRGDSKRQAPVVEVVDSVGEGSTTGASAPTYAKTVMFVEDRVRIELKEMMTNFELTGLYGKFYSQPEPDVKPGGPPEKEEAAASKPSSRAGKAEQRQSVEVTTAQAPRSGLDEGPQFHHLVQLISQEMQRYCVADGGPTEDGFVRAVSRVYDRLLEAYLAWVKYTKVANIDAVRTGKVEHMMMWLMLWEASGNLRHCPEVLCNLFHKCVGQKGALGTMQPDLQVLDDVLRRAAKTAVSAKVPEFNYDDLNEKFWSGTLPTDMEQIMNRLPTQPSTTDSSGVANAGPPAPLPTPSKTFPERGGWLAGVIFNYFFVLHFKVIFFLVVMQLDPFIELTPNKLIEAVAMTDALMCCIHTVLHFFVLSGTIPLYIKTHFRDFILELLQFFLCAFMAVTALDLNVFSIIIWNTMPRTLDAVFCPEPGGITLNFSVVYIAFRVATVFYTFFHSRIPVAVAGRPNSMNIPRRIKLMTDLGKLIIEGTFWMICFGLEYIFIAYVLEPNTVPAIIFLCTRLAEPSSLNNILTCWVPRGAMGMASLLGYIVYTNVAFVFLSTLLGLLSASFYKRLGVYQNWPDTANVRLRDLLSIFLPEGASADPSPEPGSSVYETGAAVDMTKDEYANWPPVLEGDAFDYMDSTNDKKTQPDGCQNIWCHVLTTMYNDDVLTLEEARFLRRSFERSGNVSLRPRSKEAQRRFLFFLSSLAAANSKDWKPIDVEKMRSVTVLVPVYDETIVFSSSELRQRTHIDARGDGTDFRVADIEYLVACFPDEWQNFHARMLVKYATHEEFQKTNAQEMLTAFMRDQVQPPPLEVDIRLWASFRGQTLARTVKGAFENVAALRTLLMCNPSYWKRKAEIDELVHAKCQVLVTYQTFYTHNPKKDRMEAIKTMTDAMDVLRSRYPALQLAYIKETGKEFLSVLEVMRNGLRHEKHVVKRFGAMKIGQGKAENQNHAIVFAYGECLQTLDMNQESYFEEALKMPFLLERMYQPTSRVIAPGMPVQKTDEVTCRVVGFREYPFTERLGTVGRFMGYAEWTFGTIVQRVLSYLHVRLHYGHPDVWDGFWAKTRGISKSSNFVNVNEDIFAGYELTMRGERVVHEEFIQVGKGRETSFNAAHVFETKLAMGAALQLQSRDVYRLNRSLHLLQRFSLLYGTLGFYINNAIMTYSIWMFMFTMLLLSLTGHTAHQIGTLGSSLAVEWFVQMGYVYALPLLAQMVVELGFWGGISSFLLDLPLSTIFFVFHMRTKTYYFEIAMSTGSGSWLKTGRGFGLKRSTLKEMYKIYADSHFHFGLQLVLFLGMYYSYDDQNALEQFFKTWTIILAVFSWMFSPVIFNPFTTLPVLKKEFAEFTTWLTTEPTAAQLTRMGVPKSEQSETDKATVERFINGSWAGWWMDRWLQEWTEPRICGVWEWRLRCLANVLVFRLLPWSVLVGTLMTMMTIQPVINLMILAAQICFLDFVLSWDLWNSASFKSDRGVIKALFFMGCVVYLIISVEANRPSLAQILVSIILLFVLAEVMMTLAEVVGTLLRTVQCCRRANDPRRQLAGMTVLRFAYRLDVVTTLHKGLALITVMLLFLVGMILSAFPSLHTTVLYNESVARTWDNVLNENPSRPVEMTILQPQLDDPVRSRRRNPNRSSNVAERTSQNRQGGPGNYARPVPGMANLAVPGGNDFFSQSLPMQSSIPAFASSAPQGRGVPVIVSKQ